jgi:drug/metabolite transporter (DMT)-like permease
VLLLIGQRNDPRTSNPRVIIVLVVSTLASFTSGVFFIIASWYLPAAVVTGIMENIIILLASISAFFMGNYNRVLPVAVLLAFVGNLLLLQPEFIFHNGISNIINNLSKTELTPCNSTIINMTVQCLNASDMQVYFNNTLLGVIFSIILGASFWVHEQINMPYLMNYTTINIVFFWTSLGCFILSLIVMLCTSSPIIITNLIDITYLLFLTSSLVMGSYFIMVSVNFINPTHVALVLPFSVVMLFVLQKTILKGIHPGPGNWLETVGLVCTIMATLLPALHDFMQYKKDKNKDEEESHVLIGPD